MLVRGGISAIAILILDTLILYYLTRPNVRAFFGKEERARDDVNIRIGPTLSPYATGESQYLFQLWGSTYVK